ncbi:hypothetical protein FHL15_003954 [Xylaria flabelliformis]|uniref:Uncharacterized protein n=1 Tax=Xylaria flabelliformis TaxID=2512241 RepID=A0A553I4Z5_9PEZI|nr:hypothetical protein FHL15_003954 [Xylaria flabelliformis]
MMHISCDLAPTGGDQCSSQTCEKKASTISTSHLTRPSERQDDAYRPQNGISLNASVMQLSIKNTKTADTTIKGPIAYRGKYRKEKMILRVPEVRLQAEARSVM